MVIMGFTHRVSILEGPRVVNFINAGGGDPLCTLLAHRAEGLYSWVRRREYTVYERFPLQNLIR